MSSRTVIVAFDSFKGSISAADAATAFAAGWRDVCPDDDLALMPMADGGEGTLAAFAAALSHAERVPVSVCGPGGDEVQAAWLRVPDPDGSVSGVVELASTSGIELLADDLRPWDADSLGFGQAIAAALDAGVDRLIVGIGSSASTDGGVGLLTALGGRFCDAEGELIAAGARGLVAVATADLSQLRDAPPGGITVITDVTNPLLGADGAAVVFGPQKGFTSEELERADAALAHFATLIDADPTASGAGAAGGTGFALLAWGATLARGAEEVAELIGLAEALEGADLVVTGEGSYDGQSASGKAPAHVAQLAGDAGVPVALVAGRIDDDADVSGFAASVSLTDLAGSSREARTYPARHLREAGAQLASAQD